jgi:hypothetical protein
MNLQMDLLYNLLRTCPILRSREMSVEPYLNGQFGMIDDPDRQSGSGLVLTRTRTRSDGPDPLPAPGFNHRAAECVARKMAQIFKPSGAEVKEVGTKEGSEESGKD